MSAMQSGAERPRCKPCQRQAVARQPLLSTDRSMLIRDFGLTYTSELLRSTSKQFFKDLF